MNTRAPGPPLGETERLRVGLCAACQHSRRLASAKGSSFWLCERAASEPQRLPKYPALPVRACWGFEPAPDDSTA